MGTKSTAQQAARILRTRAIEPGFNREMCLQFAEQLELQDLIGSPEFDEVAEYLARLIIKAEAEYTMRLAGMNEKILDDIGDVVRCARHGEQL